MTFAGGSLIHVFRRRTEADSKTAQADTLEPAKPGGKGRPTPKRKESEQRNRQPITAPKSRKEAYKLTRERQARERVKTREGMARGDDRYLPKRDKGPVRKLARDYVDSRRTIASNFMFVLIAIMIISFTRNPWAQLIAFFAMPTMILVVLVEGFLISRAVNRLSAERFPDESRSGVGMYAAMRSMQIRRLRMPSPAVKPGERDKV